MATVADGDSMEIESLKRERKITRSLFTKNVKVLEEILRKCADEDGVSLSITTQYIKVRELQSQLVDLDKDMRRILREYDEEDLEKDMECAMEYRARWISIDCLYKKKEKKQSKESEKRNFKLPKLEFITFDGNLKGWLPFWGQFQKIHMDVNIDESDKFQYLLQAMKENSEPRLLVETFTPSAYNECLSQLKARYAREELLIQVYVRELLAMVNQTESSSITALFDKLSANLRALETLGVTKDKFAAFLLPMVESALPRDLLVIWERAKNEKNNDTELSDLLCFLRKEVESEQRISLAKKTFEKEEVISKEPTASCLLTNLNTKVRQQCCIWCDKDSHNSLECYKLQKLTVEERRELLKKKKACPICLKKGHHARACKAFIRCVVCGQRHSTVLCTGQKEKVTKPTDVQEETASTSACMSAGGKQSTGKTTLLQTLSVIVSNGQKQVIVRAMFDSGAQRSYIKEDIARELNITPVGNETLSHCLFGGVEVTSKKYNVYNFKVMDIDCNFSCNLSALGQKCISRNIPTYTDLSISHLLNKHNITLSDCTQNTNEIGLLIGSDVAGLLFTAHFIKLQDSLVAIKTKLGWTLQGKLSHKPNAHEQSTLVNNMFCSTDLSNFWSLEALGIQDPIVMKTKQQNEQEVLANFEENVTVNKEGRYEVVLPWKVGHDDLLNNYDVASRRLQSATKKLQANDLYHDYGKIFDEWLNLGIIEVVSDPESDFKTSHYLPHRPVVREKSLTTRIRPVFDASAKDKKGKSLNVCLDKGINMLDKIPKLLNGFRKRSIGITADIAKAFLQISISPKDRDMLRFLWWDDKGKIITYRHCRVVFGLTCSPFLLTATIQYHLNQITGNLRGSADILASSYYVDNLVTSLDTEDNVSKFVKEAKEIMKQAKFDLRQWVIGGSSVKNDKTISVLGLEWHIVEDELSCNLADLPSSDELGRITKRNLLSLAQRIYDPIGFSSAVTLLPRLILQETWRRKCGWDEELSDVLRQKFVTWYESLHNLKMCRIPRRLTSAPIDECNIQLHMFCDASQVGYAACVFLRAESNGNISVRIVSAKSRIAPPGKPTIPRLELLAALIGSRLLAEARKDLDIKSEEYCWTDSCVAFYWIKNELPWNTYVGNRVKEIRQNTDVKNWLHISGTYNWADIASRGCDAAYLLSSRWLEGPTWLYLSPEEWPKSSIIVSESEEANRELKKTAVSCNTTTCTEGMTKKLLYFSKYSKIIRTVAWMFRFVYNTRNKNRITAELSYEEYEEAEKRVIKLLQSENKEDIEKKIQGITYFYDKEGIVKIKTKLLLTDVPESTKYPAALPATSSITRRLVEQRHTQLQHAGLGTVMADLRSRFWIIGARQLVKSVIANCVVCRRYRAKPTQVPTAPLPAERTLCSAPFEITGVDLTGPLFLRDGEKVWIVLYTCAVYRAVHLEVTKSLSTDAFLMTLRRFIARRGRVNVIMSDNGTNFIGSKNLLSSLDWDEIQRNSNIQRIKWKLNAPTAAWWGGFWERLIKILKDLLKRVLGQSTITYVELETILCDCEATMNSRPLTYIEDEKTFSLEPLTPSCFLQPISQTNVSDIDQIDAKSLNRRLRYMQKLRDDFRQRFKTEYLTTLVQRGKEKRDILKVGDLVLIETEEKRLKWPLGVVEQTFLGRDSVERTAKVRTSSGFKIRPFQRLYKLELSVPEIVLLKEQNKLLSSKVDTVVPSVSEKEQITRSGRVSRVPSRYMV